MRLDSSVVFCCAPRIADWSVLTSRAANCIWNSAAQGFVSGRPAGQSNGMFKVAVPFTGP